MFFDWKWITALTLFMATVGCSQPETPGVQESPIPPKSEVTQPAPAQPTPETKNQAPEKLETENHQPEKTNNPQTTAPKNAEAKPSAPASLQPKSPQPQQSQNQTHTQPAPAVAAQTKAAPPKQLAQATPKEASEVLQLVNKERAKNSLQPLTFDPLLQKAAMLKAQDMRDKNYFAHQSPTFGSPFDLMSKVGISYSYAGENIAAGQRTSAEVMTSWMNSAGHRANILNKNFTKIGIGSVAGGSYGVYWTQEFIRP